jgi:alpha-methylacyl-CoA racemase
MGPLDGIRILEFGGIGPGPFACMVLADLGADIIRLEREREADPLASVVTADRRGRPAINVDLKVDEDVALVKTLVRSADAIVEGFRPGVMERLGLGPDDLIAVNPRLVYARMTGYGQDGPMANVPGHDVNYISVAGALAGIRRPEEKPLFPHNILGDYGGGAMFLVVGVLAGVLEAERSGEGQVVDVAMVDGVALLTTLFHDLRRAGMWNDQPGTNVLDSGAHFYEVYETSDGGFISLGSMEPQFYAELLRLLEIDDVEMPEWDSRRWPEFKDRLAAVFATKTRDQWVAILENTEACATPVLSLEEATRHHHMVAREAFVDTDRGPLPAPAPRFSRTPGDADRRLASPAEALAAWGVAPAALDALRKQGRLG